MGWQNAGDTAVGFARSMFFCHPPGRRGGRSVKFRSEPRDRIDPVSEFDRNDVPTEVNGRSDDSGQQNDTKCTKPRWSAFDTAGYDIVFLGLRPDSQRQNGKQRQPPDDEVDGKGRKSGHCGSQFKSLDRPSAGAFPPELPPRLWRPPYSVPQPSRQTSGPRPTVTPVPTLSEYPENPWDGGTGPVCRARRFSAFHRRAPARPPASTDRAPR
ncbi:hypothetical protein ILFOPFJJ_04270 [Ensifer psoraleae]|nr:hypothetical protein [Sinorhizobium psoraleae]